MNPLLWLLFKWLGCNRMTTSISKDCFGQFGNSRLTKRVGISDDWNASWYAYKGFYMKRKSSHRFAPVTKNAFQMSHQSPNQKTASWRFHYCSSNDVSSSYYHVTQNTYLQVLAAPADGCPATGSALAGKTGYPERYGCGSATSVLHGLVDAYFFMAFCYCRISSIPGF